MIGPLDLTLIALYAAALFALGFSTKLRDHSVMQYLVAGRNLTLPLGVATLVCTWYGGILGIGESVQYFGAGTWLLLGVPYYVFALIYAFWLSRRVREVKEISLSERLSTVFGPRVGRAGAGMLFLLGVPSAHVLMLGVLVQFLTGWPLWASVLAGTGFGALFLFRGGLMADVRASILAFTLMYVGFAVMVGYCLLNHPPATTFQPLQAQGLLQFTGGQGWTTILGFFILGAWTLVDPGFHQRVTAMTNPDTGRRVVLVSVGFWVVFDLLTITTGLYALSLLPKVPENPLMIFPAAGLQILPDGLRAIFFCGMLGTIVSAMVGYLLVSGASLGRDLFPGASDDETRKRTQVGLLVSALVAIGLALTVQSVVGLWYSWGGVVIGALLLPVLLSYRERGPGVSAKVVWAALIAAFGVSLGLFIWSLATENPTLTVKLLGGAEFSMGTLLPGVLVSAMVLGLGRLMEAKR